VTTLFNNRKNITY